MLVEIHHKNKYCVYNWSKSSIQKVKSGTCTHEMWSAARSKIYDMVTRDDPCQGELTQKFIFGEKRTVVPSKNPAIIARRTQGIAQWSTDAEPPTIYRRDIMMIAGDSGGFLLGCDAYFAEQGAYYIDVVCAKKGGGTPLMTTFLHHFKDRAIKLSALVPVLTWYPKFKFEYGNTCEEAAKLKPELKGIGDHFASLSTDDFRKMPRNTQKAFKKLVDLKLDHASSVRGECGNKSVVPFFDKDCEAEGFNMIRCRKTKKKRSSPLAPILHRRRRGLPAPRYAF